MMVAEAVMDTELLDKIAAAARATKTRAFLVGGYVRDRVLGREPVDLDLLVEGDPSAFLSRLSALAGHHPVLFWRHEPATHRLAVGDWLVDVSSVTEGGLDRELARRDMTMNALAVSLEDPTGDIIDPLGGMDDLRAGRVRHVSLGGLDEDPLRLLRAVRLAVVLEGFRLDPSLRDAIPPRAATLARVSVERILAELEVILATPRSGQGLRLMHELGLMGVIFPELTPLAGLAQNRWHSHDAMEHTLRAVEAVDRMQADPSGLPPGVRLNDEDAEVLKWAALWHDVGKPSTALRDADGQIHFYGHETVSADLCRAALARLRMSERKIDRIATLVAQHLRLTLLSTVQSPSDRSLRRLIHQMKYDIPLLCLLALADRRAGGGPDFDHRMAQLEEIVNRVLRLFVSEADRVIAPPALLSGHEVMALLGIGPGPRVGAVLRWLTRLQVEGRVESHDAALELLRTLPASRLMVLDDEA